MAIRKRKNYTPQQVAHGDGAAIHTNRANEITALTEITSGTASVLAETAAGGKGRVEICDLQNDLSRNFSLTLRRKILNSTLDITNPAEDGCAAGLNAGLAATGAAGKRYCVIPPGLYLLESYLNFSGLHDLTVFAAGARFVLHAGLAAPTGVELDKTFPGISTYPTMLPNTLLADGASNIRIIGATFSGNYENIHYDIWNFHAWLQNCTRFIFDNCTLEKVKSVWFFGDNCKNCGFTNGSKFRENAFGSQVVKYITRRSFTGTGLNDLLVKATLPRGWGYTNKRKYQVKISSIGPDKYVWRSATGTAGDGWNAWGAWTTVERAIPALTTGEIAWYAAPLNGMWNLPALAPQPLLNDAGVALEEPMTIGDLRDQMITGMPLLSVSFAAATGHTAGDTWEFIWGETRASSVAFQATAATPLKNTTGKNNFIQNGCEFGGFPTDIGSTFITAQEGFSCASSVIDTLAISYTSGCYVADCEVSHTEIVTNNENFSLSNIRQKCPAYLDPTVGYGSDTGVVITGTANQGSITGSYFIDFAQSHGALTNRPAAIALFSAGMNDITIQGNYFINTATDKTYYGVMGNAGTAIGRKFVCSNNLPVGSKVTEYDAYITPLIVTADSSIARLTPPAGATGAYKGFEYVAYCNAGGNNAAYVYPWSYTFVKQDPYDYSQTIANQLAVVVSEVGAIANGIGLSSFLYMTTPTSASIVTNWSSFYTGGSILGHVGAFYHFRVTAAVGTGTVDTQYGLYIPSMTKATNNYSVYSAGATVPGIHAGDWSVGGNLDVDGTATIGLATLTYSLGFLVLDYGLKAAGNLETTNDAGRVVCGSVSGGFFFGSGYSIKIVSGVVGIYDLYGTLMATWGELSKLHNASANVTAANLNTLTAGVASNADALHRHSGMVAALTRSTSLTIANSAAKTVSGAVNNGSGLIRLTVTGHGYTTGWWVVGDNIGGVSAANAVFQVTVVDANTLDLQRSAFAGTYTSGGTVRRGYIATGFTASYGDATKYTNSTTNGTITNLEAGDRALSVCGSIYQTTPCEHFIWILVNDVWCGARRYLNAADTCVDFSIVDFPVTLAANDVVSVFMSSTAASGSSYGVDLQLTVKRI